MDSEHERALVEELERALAGSEQRLAVILDALAEAVTIRAPDNRLIYANQAALAQPRLHLLGGAAQRRPAGADGAV